jgi:pentatricopeptide repeat protein
MRDVLEEMSLNGVRPDRQIYYTGLFSAMKSRKLGDAMYFWEEMQRHGYQPDVSRAACTHYVLCCAQQHFMFDSC